MTPSYLSNILLPFSPRLPGTQKAQQQKRPICSGRFQDHPCVFRVLSHKFDMCVFFDRILMHQQLNEFFLKSSASCHCFRTIARSMIALAPTSLLISRLF
jgi:hypothetical protein